MCPVGAAGGVRRELRWARSLADGGSSTMGSKITKLTPVGGFAAETGAAVAILTATHFSIPSARPTRLRIDRRRRLDQTVVGRSMGIAAQIVWAWLLTILPPARLAPEISAPARCRRAIDYARLLRFQAGQKSRDSHEAFAAIGALDRHRSGGRGGCPGGRWRATERNVRRLVQPPGDCL